MGERLRWRIVDLVARLLPGQCWTDLVLWVLARPEDRAENRLPWQPIGYTCRRDFAVAGSCYCGAMRERDPAQVVQHLRSTCCDTPVVAGACRPGERCWLWQLSCVACGRRSGLMVESWPRRPREEAGRG